MKGRKKVDFDMEIQKLSKEAQRCKDIQDSMYCDYDY